MLAVPSNASLSSFRKTPQKGTTWNSPEHESKTFWLNEVTGHIRPLLNEQHHTLHPGILRALVTTFLYSDEDSCWAMASFRLRMVSMSVWSINCHIFSTLRDLEVKGNLLAMTISTYSARHLVSVCASKPESSQELHDPIVVPHVPTALGDMDQVGEDLSLLLHGSCCQDQPRHPRTHLLIQRCTYNISAKLLSSEAGGLCS